MKHVFVTGATGALGESVVEELLRSNLSVTALVRKKPRRPTPYKALVGSIEAAFVHARAIAQCDAIVHLASPRGADPRSVIEQDVFGTLQLLVGWARGPFVYASSQGLYGVPRGPLVETQPYEPSNWFDLGKIFNELQMRVESNRKPRGPAVALRAALVMPNGRRKDDRQFLSTVLEHSVGNGTFLVDSEQGLETFGTSYLGPADAGAAFVKSLSLTESGPYNVAGDYVTWKAIIDTCNRIAGTRAKIVVRKSASPANKRELRLPHSVSRLDDRRFRRATGFTSTQELGTLVEDWLRNRGVIGT
jgi:nucleoside-diphosphate-sugar epimerase